MEMTKMLLWLSGMQLLTYGVVFLIALCVVGVLVTQRWRWKGDFGLHVCVAVLLVSLDIARISGEMRRPDRDGTPDMDILFELGCLMRIFLFNFNTLLTIIGWCTIRRKDRRSRLACAA